MWNVRASMTSGPVPSTQIAHNSIAWVSADAQFLAVCSSSILAEALYRSSPFSGQSREKRRVSERHISLLIGSLQPSTNSDKLSVSRYQQLPPRFYSFLLSRKTPRYCWSTYSGIHLKRDTP